MKKCNVRKLQKRKPLTISVWPLKLRLDKLINFALLKLLELSYNARPMMKLVNKLD